MDKEIAQFSLEDGTHFLVEIEPPEGPAIERVALNTGQLVIQAKQSFEQAIDHTLKPVASALITRLKRGLTTPADEIEVKFGLKLNSEMGAILASVGGEVNFEVTLKWKQDKAA